MSERTYTPTGHGLCAHCGHDVGRHDDGHECRIFAGSFDGPADYYVCMDCGKDADDPIHDVGRVLRCLEVDDHD